MTKKEKKGILIALGYIAIMAIAMSLMHFVFHYNYTNPNMTKVLIVFEFIMTIYAIYMYNKLAKGLMFQPFQLHWALALIFAFEIIAIIVALFTGSFANHISLLLIVTLTTLLVGISEEMIFRGILLPIFMQKRNVIIAVLFSAIGFSLLHSVNVLGGLSFQEAGFQVLMTLFAGIFYALLALKIKNIIPLMILHWLWDLILITESITGASTGAIMLIPALLEYILIVPLAISVHKEYVKNTE